MIKKLYYWLHSLTSRADERFEHSGGHWQSLVRQQALLYCKGLKEGTILEVGCGEGLFLSQLASSNPGARLYGVDINPGRIERAKERFREKGLEGISLQVQQGETIGFPDDYFDSVVCINVFYIVESIETVRRLLQAMSRVCKKQGYLIFDFRNSLNQLLRLKYKLAPYYDGTVKGQFLNTYYPAQIKGVLKELGFKVVDEKTIGFPFKSWAPIIVMKVGKR